MGSCCIELRVCGKADPAKWRLYMPNEKPPLWSLPGTRSLSQTAAKGFPIKTYILVEHHIINSHHYWWHATMFFDCTTIAGITNILLVSNCRMAENHKWLTKKKRRKKTMGSCFIKQIKSNPRLGCVRHRRGKTFHSENICLINLKNQINIYMHWIIYNWIYTILTLNW